MSEGPEFGTSLQLLRQFAPLRAYGEQRRSTKSVSAYAGSSGGFALSIASRSFATLFQAAAINSAARLSSGSVSFAASARQSSANFRYSAIVFMNARSSKKTVAAAIAIMLATQVDLKLFFCEKMFGSYLTPLRALKIRVIKRNL